MKALSLAVLMFAGCASYRAQLRAEDEQQAAAEAQYQRAVQAAEETRRREMAFDSTCMQPPDQTWRDWCAARDRMKDRALRERELFDYEANMAVQQNQRQQEIDIANKEHARQVGRDISDAINAPYRH